MNQNLTIFFGAIFQLRRQPVLTWQRGWVGPGNNKIRRIFDPFKNGRLFRLVLSIIQFVKIIT